MFFEHIKDSTSKLPIRFGIECNDGWFTLLDTLMHRIMTYCVYNKIETIKIKQIKEKFGGLEFYYDNGDDYIKGLVSEARAMSVKICEFCGTTYNVGKTRGYISTICKDCHLVHPRRKKLEWIPNKDNRLLKLVKIMKKINEGTK